MVGWYFDVVVGFLIRTVTRLVKLRSSEEWPVEKGTISAATCPAAVYGGPVAELVYTYIHKGEYYSGLYRKAFMLKSSAENYVSKVVIGSQIAVRVKPADPKLRLSLLMSEIALFASVDFRFAGKHATKVTV